jgi:hypothetical protein
MSTNQPWAPTQGGAPSTTEAPGTNGPTAPSDVPQELIDPNDPRLVSEALDVNLDADAYAQPAPPPDGKYRAKLKLEGVKDDKGQVIPYTTGQTSGKRGAAVVPYFTTTISATILDASGKYDGIVVYPQFGGGANTNRRRDGSTQIATILLRLKRPDGNAWVQAGTKMNQKDWIELFIKALATEPEIGIETAWEASCMACATELKPKGQYATRTTGMHHFPAEQDVAKRKLGQLFTPELKCAANAAHGYSRARAVVVRFLHLSELSK